MLIYNNKKTVRFVKKNGYSLKTNIKKVSSCFFNYQVRPHPASRNVAPLLGEDRTLVGKALHYRSRGRSRSRMGRSRLLAYTYTWGPMAGV